MPISGKKEPAAHLAVRLSSVNSLGKPFGLQVLGGRDAVVAPMPIRARALRWPRLNDLGPVTLATWRNERRSRQRTATIQREQMGKNVTKRFQKNQ
jgi:hypothetical protein